MDFCDRMFDHDLNRRVLESLIKAGAFDRMGGRRSQLMQVFGQVLDGIAASRKRNVEGQMDLFGFGGGEGESTPLPTLHLPDIPEYTPQELMTMEKEVTGLYLTGHPMDAYREIARKRGAVTIGSILNDFEGEEGPQRFRDGERVTVAGVIATYKTRTTRNNTLMAYVNLEDDTASMELLCFSRVLGESGGYIRENSAVLVTGRISVRDEKEPQIMVDTIAPLNQGEVQQQEKEPRLYIRMPSRQDPRMRKVELVLSFFPGEGQAVLYFEDTKKRYGARCLIHPALIQDLKERLAPIIVGYTYAGAPVTAADLKAQGAMAALLKDALKPNLVQTLEHTPALVHGGPFANIAHGCNSIAATRLALKLGDYVVTEAGFGADLGAEKFLDIKCRMAGLTPDAVVVVATVRALKHHGGVAKADLNTENLEALERGLPNLLRHVENITKVYGLPCVVAINRFPTDTEAELKLVDRKSVV